MYDIAVMPLIQSLRPTVYLNKGQLLLANAFKGMDAFCYASRHCTGRLNKSNLESILMKFTYERQRSIRMHGNKRQNFSITESGSSPKFHYVIG